MSFSLFMSFFVFLVFFESAHGKRGYAAG